MPVVRTILSILTHEELDARLDRAAGDLSTYDAKLREFIETCDTKDRPLEVVDSTAW
jgi:hypothetical protein